MSGFSYENQGTHTYLVYEIGMEDTIDSMSLGMLTHNKIAGLAETSFAQLDTSKYVKYDITSRVSVKQFFTGQVNKARLLGVFRGIANALLAAEDYMIDARSIVLDTEYIFADVSTCDTVLICLPIQTEAISWTEHDICTFFKNIIFSTQYDQTENCDHVAQIINYLNSAPAFSLENFMQVLNQIQNTQPPKAAKPVQSGLPTSEVRRTQDASGGMGQQNSNHIQPQVLYTSPPRTEKPPIAAAASNTVTTPPPVAGENTEAEKMSMLYLLRHFSKENAELYKKQKPDASAAGSGKGKHKKKNKADASDTKSKRKKTNHPDIVGFEIPQTNCSASNDTPYGEINTNNISPSTEVNQYTITQNQASTTVWNEQPKVLPQTAGSVADFGDTVMLSQDEETGTTVLTATPQAVSKPHMIRQKNRQTIWIDKPLFKIGHEQSYVDYYVSGNPAISRSHANIITKDDGYYIVDTNSTNHTYVNGTLIQSNQEIRLEHGTIFMLANESFEFRLY